MKKSLYLKKLETDLRKVKDNIEQELELLREIGENYFNDDRFDDSLNRFDQMVVLCSNKRSLQLDEYHFEGLRRCIDCLIELELLEEADVKADAYVKLARDRKCEAHIQQALLNKARVSRYLAERPDVSDEERRTLRDVAERMFLGSECSLTELRKMAHLSSALEIPRKRASLYQNMAQFFCNTNQIDKAIDYLKRGIEVAAKSSDLSDVLMLLYAEAQVIYEKRGSYQTCIQYAMKELCNVEKVKEKQHLKFSCLYNIARFCCLNNDVHKAYSHLKTALSMKKAEKFDNYLEAQRLAKKLKFATVLEDAMGNSGDEAKIEKLGDVYASVSAFDLSNAKYKQVLKLLKTRKLEFCEKQYDLCLSICLNLCDAKSFQLAANDYIQLSFEIQSGNAEIDDREAKLSKLYRQLCRCYMKLEDFANRDLYFEKAQNMADASECAVSIEKCLDLKTQIRASNFVTDLPIDSDCEDADEENVEEFLNVEISSGSDSDTGVGKPKGFVDKQKRNAKGETKLQEAVIKGKYSVVSDLITKGYSVNVTDNNGWTPLHEAANHGFVELCKLLVEAGAIVDRPMKETGLTPLMDAIESHQFECAKVLLEMGAYPYTTGKIGICAADSFEKIVDECYSENNTTVEMRELFEDIRKLIGRKQRPKYLERVKLKVNEKVLSKHLLSTDVQQCPEVVEKSDAEDVGEPTQERENKGIYHPSCNDATKNDMDEPGNAMKIYEDALKQQSSRNALYRSKTAKEFAMSDRIRDKRKERAKTRPVNLPGDNSDVDDSWIEDVRMSCWKDRKRKHSSDSDSGIRSMSTKTSDLTSVCERSLVAADAYSNRSDTLKASGKRPVKRKSRVQIESESESDTNSDKENSVRERLPSKRNSINSQLPTLESVVKHPENSNERTVLNYDRDRPAQIDVHGYLNDSFVETDASESLTDHPDKNDYNTDSKKCFEESEDDCPPSPVIGTKSRRNPATSNDHIQSRLSPNDPDVRFELSAKPLKTCDSPELSSTQRPFCSTMISVPNSENPHDEENVFLLANLSPVRKRGTNITIHFVSQTVTVGFKTSVEVENGDATLKSIVDEAVAKFKKSFFVEPIVDIKFRGTRLEPESCLKDNVMSAKTREKVLFCMVKGWNVDGLKDQFLRSCGQANQTPCDYALQVVQDCENCNLDVLGAFDYSNSDMTRRFLECAMFQSINHLALTKIMMTQEHFVRIGRVVATCSSLKELTLTKNRMDLECLNCLVAEVLRMAQENKFLFSNLQFLNFSDNFLLGKVLKTLADLFTFCSKIKSINLNKANLNEDFLKGFESSDNASFCRSIQKIQMAQNSLSNECKSKILCLFRKDCVIKL